jgi:hypothetical protein
MAAAQMAVPVVVAQMAVMAAAHLLQGRGSVVPMAAAQMAVPVVVAQMAVPMAAAHLLQGVQAEAAAVLQRLRRRLPLLDLEPTRPASGESGGPGNSSAVPREARPRMLARLAGIPDPALQEGGEGLQTSFG